jgi:hypothetical protein
MTDEERNILTEDLFGRLAHEVVIKLLPDDDDEYLFSARINDSKWLINDAYYVDEVRPYLRPMESMSIEELNECMIASGIHDIPCPNWKNYEPTERLKHSANVFKCDSRQVEWLNAHHFDYRGLIGMGLALEAKVEMYQ